MSAPNVPFGITSPSCKLWLPPGPGGTPQGDFDFPNYWLGASGALIPENGLIQTLYDQSGNANSVTQASSGNAPFLARFAAVPWSSQPCARFRSTYSHYLTLPSGVTMGDGSPANEGTIIMCVRSQPGNNGFYWATGGFGFWPQGSFGQLNIFNGSENPFPNPFAVNTFGPQVIAIRFKSGETKLYGDTNYTDTIATNLLTGTLSGGYIGSLNGSGYFADFDFYDLAIFDQALSDADVLMVMQGMKDRVAPNEGLYAQVLAFGDSRTYGHNSNNGDFTQIARNWPSRVKASFGGAGQWYSSAHTGDTIANQSTALTAYLTFLKPSIYSKRIVIGEIGINDIRAGSSATTIQTALQNLATQIKAVNPTSIFFMTIAPGLELTSGQESVRQAVNAWLLAENISGVSIIDNASDARLQIPAGSTQGTAGPSNGYNDADGLHWYDPGLGVYVENVTAVLAPLFAPQRTVGVAA